jgi:hypothetical protein
MSGHRWNNRFNPPLETASVRFPRAPVETPQVPTNRLTHQMPGAPPLNLYTNQITSIPDLSMSIVTSNIVELTVTLDVSFGYRMKGTDHFEFTFTNSNTGVSTTKSFQQMGNTYTIGEFDPGVNYFVYVTPVINGLFTASSAVQEFLSSPASAPGVLQSLTLTGSGSYAIIDFAGVYPTSPFPNQVAVNTNFGDAQVLVDVSFGNRQLVIGPYTNGSSYQFVLTPVTRSEQGIYRYGSTSTIPSGNNYFIPGPPGTLNINSIYANGRDGATVNITMSSDTIVHPIPDSFETTAYTSTLIRVIATLTGVSGQINDLSTSYPAFTVSSGLISTQDYLTLSAAVGSSNLVADITDNTGVWYSFRVSSISSGHVYTFTNPNLTKSVLTGSSFSVNFNTLRLTSFISTVTTSESAVELSSVQTDTYTTFITRAFANNVYSVESDYATIFAGPPALPNDGTQETGNETVRWTLRMYGYNLQQDGSRPIGPRPIYYTIDQDGVPVQTISSFVATISGLTNGTSYTLAAAGFANGVYGPSNTITVIPDFAAPSSLAVTRISNVNVTLSLGRPLGGTQYGYIVSACGLGGYSVTVSDQIADYIPVSITGLAPSDYQFIAYTQYQESPSNITTLSALTPGSYYLGPPSAPSNVRGIYLGTSRNGGTTVDLVLTASHGSGAIVTNYLLEHNYGAQITVSALPNQDLYYNFIYLYAYNSYIFTITPIGNEVLGPPVNSATFDFNPQPPSSADLFMSGGNGGTMNISFATASVFPYGQTTDYYTISAIRTAFITGDTQKFVSNSPVSYDAAGVLYQFAVYTTICGIISSTYALTPAVTGGPPVQPNVGYTLGSNQITFSLSVNANSAVKISNYFITEYYQDVSSGGFLPTGTTYTVPVTPSLTPVATYTVSGLFTTSYSIIAGGGTWIEAEQSTPDFTFIPQDIITSPLALSTYSNLVTLTLSQGSTAITFPVTSFVPSSALGYITYKYATNIVAKQSLLFDSASSLQFAWRSGTGPFTGGTYRYNIQSRGNDTLISPVTTKTINLYVAAPGQPSVVTNNTTATVSFSPPPSTSVPPAYYVVSDNYGRTVSGLTNLSSYVFTNCTTGSAYSYFVTTYAQDISSAPSPLSIPVYPGRPGAPLFQPSFAYTAGSAILTLSTLVNQGPAIPYIPITDICMRIQGQLSYIVNKTNISSSYTTNGPTFTVRNLSLGESYVFTLSAYANQVYSTIASSYSYYVGSIPPNIPNLASIIISNTTATVSVSAAIPSTKIGGIHPDSYVFSVSGETQATITQIVPGTYSYTTTIVSPVSVTVNGAAGGPVPGMSSAGLGGRAQYVFTNVPAGTVIQYTVGAVGSTGDGYWSIPGGGGNESTVKIGSIQIIAGGGGAGGIYVPPPEWTNGGGGIFGGRGGTWEVYNVAPRAGFPGSGGSIPPVPGVISVTGGGGTSNGSVSITVGTITPDVVIPYNPINQTYTATFSGLITLADYQFSGYTITGGLSSGGSWTDAPRIFNAGGPRPITGITYSLPGGTPLTTNISLRTVITTDATGSTGLWADTSYFISVVPGGSGPGTYSFTTISDGIVDFVLGGGNGGNGGTAYNGTGQPGGSGGRGAVVRYSQNVSAGTTIYYTVGAAGSNGSSQTGFYDGGGGGGGGRASYLQIGNVTITAGGGGGGGGGGSIANQYGIDGLPGTPIGTYGGSKGAGGSPDMPGLPGGPGQGGPLGEVTPGGNDGPDGFVIPSGGGYSYSTMTTSTYTSSIVAGNTYVASVYALKNQVVGQPVFTPGIAVSPTPPISPFITLYPTSDVDITSPIIYQPTCNVFTTTISGNLFVTLKGGAGIGSGLDVRKGRGGYVSYMFVDVPIGTLVEYSVGGVGELKPGSAGGGGATRVTIGLDTVEAGGGGGLGNIALGGTVTGFPGGGYNGWAGAPSQGNSDAGDGSGGILIRDLVPGVSPFGLTVIKGGGGGDSYSGNGSITFEYVKTIPAKFEWSPALTSNVNYYYSINQSTYINNNNGVTALGSLMYGTTSVLNVYSLINGISSGIVKSISAYAFTNPPTSLTYGRTSNNVTLSWGSAFQPAHVSNITYTTSVTVNANASGLSIRSTGGPSIVVGSNIMSESIYLQINTAAGITKQPIVVTLAGLSLSYYQTYQVTSATKETFGSSVIGYQFSGAGPSLPNYTGSNIVFSITNPSALPTDGYTVHDLCSGTIIASNIQSNSISISLTLGNTYNIAIQAFNLSMYSYTNSAHTGLFKLETTAVATLSTTYISSNVKLTWKTPTQFDGVTPSTTPPYTWTVFNASGGGYLARSSPASQLVDIVGALGGTYRYYIIVNYYGISSEPTYGNQISLRTTPSPSATQTTLGQGIIVVWQTASQSVYLPETPTVLSSVFPNGGYVLIDLCGNYTGTISAGPEDTDVYIPITAPPYKYYNFGVSAIHNGISSTATAPGAVFLGVNPPTNPVVSLNGMVATLTWNAPVINGPNAPYQIYDTGGYPIGDPTTNALRTITCNTPGIYSFTAIANETIVVIAYGAGGSVGAGGLASNTYSVTSGTTIVARVGVAGPAGDSTTVYVPNFFNPNLILDAGGGGGFTVSGEGFFRNGGLPYPDGGPPGQSGYGSGGSAVLGGGSPKSTNGQVSITMTNQSFRSSLSTATTSISFLITNATSYNFQIVSYSNGLTASANITLNTTVASPLNLRTKFTGIILSNEWELPETIPSSFLLTNLTTGTYNVVTPGTITNETFSETGVPGQRYRFALYSVKSGIPSSTQIISTSVLLFSTSPSNFKGSNNGTTVTFTASGVPGTPLETFTLTDGSGNLITSGMPQFIVNGVASVQIPPITGLTSGRTYAFNLYGITSGLSSVPVPTSVGLTIPGSTTLGSSPVISSVDSFSRPGTGTFTVLPGNILTLYMYGSDGGTGVGMTAPFTFPVGGAGAYVFCTIPAQTDAYTFTYRIGAGGRGGYPSPITGGAGGGATTVAFGNTYIVAGGGGGGGSTYQGSFANGEDGYGGSGGAGGTANAVYANPGGPGSGSVSGPPSGMWYSITDGGAGYIYRPGNTGPNGYNGFIRFFCGPFNQASSTITVYQCIPPADAFKVISTNLVGTIYSNLPTAGWLGVTMEIDGGTVVAINDASNGSNVWVSTNQGLGWGSSFIAGLSGATARNVTIAANGTWGALATTSGLWVSSNVSSFSPWFYVSNTTGSNIQSVGFSPDGSTLIVGQTSGYLYSISSSQLNSLSPVFTGGQGVYQNSWAAIAWSGQGNMVFAAGNGGGNPLYSTTGGTFWTQFGGNDIYTSVSPNSNGTYVLLGKTGYPDLQRRNISDYVWTPMFPSAPTGLLSLSQGRYICACSYTGDIQTAVISGAADGGFYISYDFGNSWILDTRFTAPAFTGVAVSSNGFVQVVVGSNVKIQTNINEALPSTTITIIPISTSATSSVGLIPQGATGYEVIPYYRNISGPPVFVWSTPQPGPALWPQTSGPASYTTPPYASGYSTTGGLEGYFVVNNTVPSTITATSLVFYTGPSTLASTPMLSNADIQVFKLSAPSGILYPGPYSGRFTVGSGNSTTMSISIPLNPPLALVLTNQTSNIYGSWTAPNGYGPTYNIYSNGVFKFSTTNTNATIPCTGASPTIFGVSASLGGVVSTINTSSAYPPPAPASLTVSGYVTATTVELTWAPVPGASYYYITSSGDLVSSSTTVTKFVTSLPFLTVPTVFGVAALSNNLLGAYSYITITNRIGGETAPGITKTVAITSPFIVTGMYIMGGGGGGGSGGYGAAGGPGQPPTGLQGGGGGAQGGIERFAGGTGPIYSQGTTLTLVAGKSGTGGLYGGGGTGGQLSYIQIGGNTAAWAGGGGGGGGGNGGPGSAGGRIEMNGITGNGGSGGTTPSNTNGGGGGYGGWGNYVSITQTPLPTANYSPTIGSNGQNRQGTPPNATTGGAGGGGSDGGAAQPSFGGTGNYATGYGGGGGGGARSANPTGNPSTAPPGGPGGDGYVSISYAYLTS